MREPLKLGDKMRTVDIAPKVANWHVFTCEDEPLVTGTREECEKWLQRQGYTRNGEDECCNLKYSIQGYFDVVLVWS